MCLAKVMGLGGDTWHNQVSESQTQDFVRVGGEKLSGLCWNKWEDMRWELCSFHKGHPCWVERLHGRESLYILRETGSWWYFLSLWANSAWRIPHIVKLRKSIIFFFVQDNLALFCCLDSSLKEYWLRSIGKGELTEKQCGCLFDATVNVPKWFQGY